MNVILISLDTVRPDHLSGYGYHRKTTPNIDQIAKDGALFTQAFSQAPSTHPSHLAIFTSRYPTSQWVSWEGNDLEESTETLTEVLKRHGYITAAFTGLKEANHNSSNLLASRPFQAFDQLTQGVSLSWLPGEVFKWLWAHQEQPFFLFVHGYDAHEPHVLSIGRHAKRFNPTYHGNLPSTRAELEAFIASVLSSSEIQQLRSNRDAYAQLESGLYWRRLGYDGSLPPNDLKRLQALYDAQIYYLDQGLGELFQALKHLNLMERTLIVILSDHGQAFGEHGLYAVHGRCYDEDTRIVLIIHDPRLRRRRETVRHIVQAIDVMPTILELVNLPIPASAQGRSLVGLLRDGGRDASREAVAVSVGGGLRAIRTPQWKLISTAGVPTELYHVARDPQEQRNLITKHPTIAAQLQWRLDQVVSAEAAGPAVDLRQWLQEKGYW